MAFQGLEPTRTKKNVTNEQIMEAVRDFNYLCAILNFPGLMM